MKLKFIYKRNYNGLKENIVLLTKILTYGVLLQGSCFRDIFCSFFRVIQLLGFCDYSMPKNSISLKILP